MTNILWWTQFIFALLGTISSAVWYIVEKRRVRYISVLWFFWCAILMVYRIYRWTLITVTQSQALFINSILNELLLFGALSVVIINISHIVGARHGNIH